MTKQNVRKLAAIWIPAVLVLVTLITAGCKTGPQFSELPGLTGPATAAMGPAATTPVAAPAPAGTGSQGAAIATPAGSAAQDAAREIDTFHVGDILQINFSDLPILVPVMEEKVKEDGSITLLQNQNFTAAGKLRGQLESEIRARYVPQFFKTMTVTVKQQKDTQFYYVQGEVKVPARQVYISRITVLKAIASSGDFTDFARRTAVELTRADGRKFKVNCKKAQKDPRLDLEVLPGDNIRVPRRNPIW